MTNIDIAKLAKVIARQTDANDHNGAAITLANHFGHERERTILAGILHRADTRGSGDALEITMRDYIVAQIIKRLDVHIAREIHAAF